MQREDGSAIVFVSFFRLCSGTMRIAAALLGHIDAVRRLSGRPRRARAGTPRHGGANARGSQARKLENYPLVCSCGEPLSLRARNKQIARQQRRSHLRQTSTAQGAGPTRDARCTQFFDESH